MSFNFQWKTLIEDILRNGDVVSPRGKQTFERPQKTLVVGMTRPVLTVPQRKLSYQGMAAEAHWILTGDNTLAGIAPWLPKMKDFSDDGVTLAGAYGPRIRSQLDYVVAKLLQDQDTRQATLSIWTPNPEPSKDYPCTVAMDFKIRTTYGKRRLNMHVFMRSSDVWLGIPYDVFSFSMVAHLVCCRLNTALGQQIDGWLQPGALFLTAASSHLYKENWLSALECARVETEDSQYDTLESMYTLEPRLIARLEMLRSTAPGDLLRWWESGK